MVGLSSKTRGLHIPRVRPAQELRVKLEDKPRTLGPGYRGKINRTHKRSEASVEGGLLPVPGLQLCCAEEDAGHSGRAYLFQVVSQKHYVHAAEPQLGDDEEEAHDVPAAEEGEAGMRGTDTRFHFFPPCPLSPALGGL